MHKGSAKTWLSSKGVTLLLKATLPTCVLSRRGLSLLQHAPRFSPYDMGAGSHASCKLAQGRRSQTTTRGARNCPAVTSIPPLSPGPAGERADRHAGGMQPHQGDVPFRLRCVQAWRPRPTRHVTGAPVTTCKKLHRHSRHYRASSTAEPIPRLEATLRMTQQYQPGTSVMGQSATGEGATSDTARKGPAVMTVAGGRKQPSRRQQAHAPSWDSERTLSHGVKTAHPCSVPRTARACATAAPRTTRPVALTLRQDRRHLWRAKQATIHLRHNDHVKKGAPRRSILYPFPLPLSLSCDRDWERRHPERDPSSRRKRAPSPLVIRGSKAGPSEGFNSRLRALGLRAHYWSEVRRPAPQKGSTAASVHSGSAPTTDQGFVGWPPKGSTATSDAERGMALGTFDT
jgi:hypothetical protein